ncbi:MAG: flippase-like domain-containing protein [Planctomycetes bacterium]|nr:flippase-like domain-containing protein [Planctomycetota bacterium]MCL4729789.1 flippase-like domain-containing protein [Planctomycetota bacterium]
MKRVLHYTRRFLPLAFGVAVLVYLFAFRTDPRDNINAIKGIEPLKLFLAVGLCLVSFVATAWRLKLLVSVLGHRVSLWRVFVYTLIGHLYNSAIPGGAVGGDAIKALYLSQATGSKPQAFAAVMVDRLCGLFMMAALALAMLLPLIDEPTMRQAAAVILGFAGCATAAIVVLTSRRIRKLIPKGTSRKLPFSDAIRAFDEAMQIFRGHKRGLVGALLVSMLPQTAWIGMHIAIGDGIGAGLPWTEYAVLVPVTGMISALPISFGGWGVGEAASIYFFGLRGVAEQSALLISLGGRTLQLGWSLLGLPLSLVLPRPRELARAVEGEPVLEESQSPAAGTAGEG